MMIEKAYVDRIDGQHAILLVGASKRKVPILLRLLPKGTREGVWLKIEFSDDGLSYASLDPDQTNRAQERITKKLDDLRKK